MFKVIKENFVVIGKERRKREYCFINYMYFPIREV